MRTPTAVDAALEELYATPPAEFTARRNALAKRLAAQGDDDGAAAVAARRKPTQVAWVLNQLARRSPDEIAELTDIGRELAREQRRALRGQGGSSFRESIARQREIVGRATRDAARLMKELGVDTSAHLDEVASALEAALVDPAAGAALEEGRLEKPPATAVGFAIGRTEELPHAESDRPRQAPAARRATAKDRAQREAREKARRAAVVRDARRELRGAEAHAKRRRAAAEKAEAAAHDALEHARQLVAGAEASARAVEAAKRALASAEAGERR